MLFLIGGSLGFLFEFLNINFSGNNKKIDDNSNKTSDPNEYFDLVKLNSTSALCLDGSPASYYISRNGNPSKILLLFEGGAWCADSDYNKTIGICY